MAVGVDGRLTNLIETKTVHDADTTRPLGYRRCMRPEHGTLILALASCGAPSSEPAHPPSEPASQPPTFAYPFSQPWMLGATMAPREWSVESGCTSLQRTGDPPFLKAVSCTAPLGPSDNTGACTVPAQRDSKEEVKVACEEDSAHLPKEAACEPKLRPFAGGARRRSHRRLRWCQGCPSRARLRQGARARALSPWGSVPPFFTSPSVLSTAAARMKPGSASRSRGLPGSLPFEASSARTPTLRRISS